MKILISIFAAALALTFIGPTFRGRSPRSKDRGRLPEGGWCVGRQDESLL
jgi:hypothetical protein